MLSPCKELEDWWPIIKYGNFSTAQIHESSMRLKIVGLNWDGLIAPTQPMFSVSNLLQTFLSEHQPFQILIRKRSKPNEEQSGSERKKAIGKATLATSKMGSITISERRKTDKVSLVPANWDRWPSQREGKQTRFH
jgi:hypothetical protein